VDWANCCVGYTWSHGFTRAKNFHVDVIAGDAPRRKTSTQVLEKCGWSTQVKVCVARYTKFIKHGYAEVPSGGKFQIQTIIGRRPAVQYSTVAVLQRLHKAE
jgi:hypothetical protein